MSRLLYHPLTIAIITGISLILFISLYINGREIRQSGQLITTLESDVKKTSEDVEKTQQKLQEAQTPYTKEKIIRDQLLMQKPGEFIVQIPDVVLQNEEKPTIKKNPTPLEQWRQLLKI